ncbi:hypothetical protein KVP06_13755 [Geobacter sulfurreducens]|uniref:hypothetical protein n=1 Tax=Geobacter sulfurreducens TaxID=35554 RepID=UPI00117D1133|nr:hypothetical protein [Geobacter sulfurreducens]UAC03429.1 hypothetical protein KVP06_13755 [Geobacter sulfurreducens]
MGTTFVNSPFDRMLSQYFDFAVFGQGGMALFCDGLSSAMTILCFFAVSALYFPIAEMFKVVATPTDINF